MLNQKTLENIHTDVEFANRYRLEYIKHFLSLATGIFVISIAFMKDIIGMDSIPIFKTVLIVGWVFLIFSIIGGVFHMKAWDRFYISYRKSEEEGKKRRKKINKLRIIAEVIQIVFFIFGLIMIFIFASFNLLK